MEELHSCLSERRRRCHAALMSVSGAVIDVIVLKLRRPSVLRREGLAPLGGGDAHNQPATAAAAVLTEKKLPLQIFPTAANKIQMPQPELFVPGSFPPSFPSLFLFSLLLSSPLPIRRRLFANNCQRSPLSFRATNHLLSSFHLPQLLRYSPPRDSSIVYSFFLPLSFLLSAATTPDPSIPK